ncbi:MAG: FKBP-type peptidyl-prolyl cis-trans isomerase [Acidobacteria bacterium]|nr:FKBP-type peptidyl-prolyl cis-trans isomerase [Acidobacteriota bacterium]
MTSLTLIGLLLIIPALTAQTPPATPRMAVPPAPPDVAAAPAESEKTASGIAHKLLAAGNDATKPGPTDVVVVHYSGWTADGKLFDSSALRNRPSTLLMDRVIPGWIEGLQLMSVGEKRRFWIPEPLTFKGQEGKPKGTLAFDIELLEVSSSPRVAPADVARAPDDAKRTGSGLAYKVLRAGTGATKPKRSSRVTVHYTGWTTDGKMFDSSVLRGPAAIFRLDEVIEGWTEGLQLMVVGEKTRFWIPESLAYKGREGSPRGMLVFDVELIGIEN